MVHFGVLEPLRKIDAVPLPLPLADVSNSMCTLRVPFRSSIVPMQPLRVRTPLPLASNTPLQQKRYSPVTTLNRTTFPALVSSTRHALNVVTVKLQVAVLPEASVAVQVTVVVPTGNIDPE